MKNEIDKLIPQELIAMTRFVSAAMVILNARLFTLLGTMLAASMFGWAMWMPDPIRLASACAFSLLICWPLFRMEHRRIATIQEDAS